VAGSKEAAFTGGFFFCLHRHVAAATNCRALLKFLTNGYGFAAEMWRHNRIAVAKGSARRFLNQMHIIATHARHRA